MKVAGAAGKFTCAHALPCFILQVFSFKLKYKLKR
jgi:hypothetical protein